MVTKRSGHLNTISLPAYTYAQICLVQLILQNEQWEVYILYELLSEDLAKYDPRTVKGILGQECSYVALAMLGGDRRR